MNKVEDLVPIPGTKRRKYLEENVAAVETQLSPEEVNEIDSIFPPDATAGTRYQVVSHKLTTEPLDDLEHFSS